MIDDQGTDLLGWTWDEPITANEFRAIVWQYGKDHWNDPGRWQDFTSDRACEEWQVELEEVRP
jgi:hypothetical protein